jgi:DNA polymerase I-like protein with 3'-5' exonuclease and polymerase domains
MGRIPQFIANPDPSIYFSDNYLILDFEVDVNDGRFGSAIDGRNHLALACWKHKSDVCSYRFGSEFDQAQLAEAVRKADFIVGHNLKYEYGWLARCGVDTRQILGFDTLLAEYVLLGNLAAGDVESGVRPTSISLDACCERRGYARKDPIVDLWMEHGIKVSEMPRKWVLDRCKQDVRTTEQLFRNQRRELADTNRLGCLYTRCILTPLLASVEKEGCHLDDNRVYEVYTEYAEKFRQRNIEFDSLTGGINWRSSKQVAAYLYDTLGFAELRDGSGEPKRTPSGGRQTNAKALEKLKATTDVQKEFLGLRKQLSKIGSALSKNLDYFKEVCEHHNGTFHAEFNQAVTATHRLSSTGIAIETAAKGSKSCQLTNIPRNFKRLFAARRDGWLVGEADGAQIEFRVAAFLGNDRQARSDIADRDFDAHCVTAAAMYEIPYTQLRSAYLAGDKVATDRRQSAKSETFKPLYGGSKGTPAQERWYEAFKRRYPDLAKTQAGWVYEVLERKYLTTPWGMRYYWPNIRMSSRGYVNSGAAIYNYPIQALATAEIIPIAITCFWHAVRAEGLDEVIIPINTVHDSLVCEIHPDHANDFRRLATEAFGPRVLRYLSIVYGLDFDVPLGTGIKIGSHWSEGIEERYECINGQIERVK